MFKKTIAVAVCMGLLGQNMLFAQEQQSLEETQKQAKSAWSVLTEKTEVNKAVWYVSTVALFVANGLYFHGVYQRNKLEKENAKLRAQNKTLKKQVKGSQVTLKGKLPPGVSKDGMQVASRDWYKEFTAEPVSALDPDINYILAHADNEELMLGRANTMFKNKSITLKEYNELTKWIENVHGTVSKGYGLRQMMRELEVSSQLTLPKSALPKRMAALLFKRYALVTILVAGFAFLSTTDAQAQDTSMAGRIAANPELFIKATPEQIAEIEQNPQAAQFCRDFTEQLVELSKLPAEELQQIVQEAEAQLNTERRNNIIQNGLKRELRHSLAR